MTYLGSKVIDLVCIINEYKSNIDDELEWQDEDFDNHKNGSCVKTS
jgi:hypothetical protein